MIERFNAQKPKKPELTGFLSIQASLLVRSRQANALLLVCYSFVANQLKKHPFSGSIDQL